MVALQRLAQVVLGRLELLQLELADGQVHLRLQPLRLEDVVAARERLQHLGGLGEVLEEVVAGGLLEGRVQRVAGPVRGIGERPKRSRAKAHWWAWMLARPAL